MVVVIFKGNLAIAQGVTVRPAYNTTYDGPKGFLLFIKGDFVNNHGAVTLGKDIYLQRGDDGNYEDYTVIAQGAQGGERRIYHHGGSSGGKAGYAGEGRQTGGGAAAGCYVISDWAGSGDDIYFTSYSGGGGDKG